MDLENQKRVKEFAEKYGPENIGLTCYPCWEPEVKAEFDPQVYEDQVGMMEMVLDVEDIQKEMQPIREQYCKYLGK